LWQNLANTGELDYYLIGRLDNHHDKSGFEGIRRVFSYHAQNEPYYKKLVSRADILIVRNVGWGGDGEDRGWVRFLTELHFLFDEVLTEGLCRVDLQKYKAIVLTDAKYLSDNDCKKLDDYVFDGGVLIATGESGHYDEDYEPRELYPLKSMGITGKAKKSDNMRSAMLLIENKNKYPSFKNWDTDVLYFGDRYFICEYENGVQKHLELIPPHHYGPPERCYYNEISDLPGFTINSFGTGKGVHIPWYPGALFHNEGYVNTEAFISDMLSSVLCIEPIETNASPMIEITMSDGDGFSLVQLINTSGHFGNSFFQPIPIDGVQVTIPFEKEPSSCISLRDRRQIPFEYVHHKLNLMIGKLDFFDAIKIE